MSVSRLVAAVRRRRERAVAAGADSGSAVVEFVVLGVLLLVPVVYLVLCVARVQAAVFAAEGAARESARVIAAPGAGSTGRADAETVVGLALADQGFDSSAARLDVRCSTDPCSAPDSLVRTTVTVEVGLPGVPALLDGVVPARVPVVATGTAAGDRFAAAP
ncbi:pilus assembly protein [uncultured Pseudokineococcus sp.]|uniref:pilus assembly protein n=1 Tax=uncultured Pseudokineococcus sp. TaxID=1642928 RepID=UPI0026380DF6|nr:pilus assembly protein [uncultured Pseudokineococcus sp.]